MRLFKNSLINGIIDHLDTIVFVRYFKCEADNEIIFYF
jgi:hypothetical protein